MWEVYSNEETSYHYYKNATGQKKRSCDFPSSRSLSSCCKCSLISPKLVKPINSLFPVLNKWLSCHLYLYVSLLFVTCYSFFDLRCICNLTTCRSAGLIYHFFGIYIDPCFIVFSQLVSCLNILFNKDTFNCKSKVN